jgi:four helix bundle protein
MAYIKLSDLEVYKTTREISEIAWRIYGSLSWQEKKIFGDQHIESADSIGANIAEGYGRFHYLDKIKFYYNARGSLFECQHWTELMEEREIGDPELLAKLKNLLSKEEVKLNNFIGSTYKSRNKEIYVLQTRNK